MSIEKEIQKHQALLAKAQAEEAEARAQNDERGLNKAAAKVKKEQDALGKLQAKEVEARAKAESKEVEARAKAEAKEAEARAKAQAKEAQEREKNMVAAEKQNRKEEKKLKKDQAHQAKEASKASKADADSVPTSTPAPPSSPPSVSGDPGLEKSSPKTAAAKPAPKPPAQPAEQKPPAAKPAAKPAAESPAKKDSSATPPPQPATGPKPAAGATPTSAPKPDAPTPSSPPQPTAPPPTTAAPPPTTAAPPPTAAAPTTSGAPAASPGPMPATPPPSQSQAVLSKKEAKAAVKREKTEQKVAAKAAKKGAGKKAGKKGAAGAPPAGAPPGATPPAGARPPVAPPRRRSRPALQDRMLWIILGIILIAVSIGSFVVLLDSASQSKTSVLVSLQEIPAGTEVSRLDFVAEEVVLPSGAASISPASLEGVQGKVYASTRIPARTIINIGMLSQSQAEVQTDDSHDFSIVIQTRGYADVVLLPGDNVLLTAYQPASVYNEFVDIFRVTEVLEVKAITGNRVIFTADQNTASRLTRISNDLVRTQGWFILWSVRAGLTEDEKVDIIRSAQESWENDENKGFLDDGDLAPPEEDGGGGAGGGLFPSDLFN